MKNSSSPEQASKSPKREANNSKTSNFKKSLSPRETSRKRHKSTKSRQLKCQCTRIGLRRELLQARTIKLVVEAAGPSRLLVLARLLRIFQAMTKSFKNTPFNNCSIAMKVTTPALEAGCMKATNMFLSLVFYERTITGNTEDKRTDATLITDG